MEAAVVGVSNQMYGQIVVAVVCVKHDPKNPDKQLSEVELKEFLKTRLAHYKLPKHIYIVPSIPRNQLGKVNKKTLLKDLIIQV